MLKHSRTAIPVFVTTGLLILSLAGSSALAALYQGFTYQGRFLNPDGSDAMKDVVDLVIGIYSPDGECLLYEERNSDIDLSKTSGYFAVHVGSEPGDPKRTGEDPGKPLSLVFSNSGAIRTAGINCATGYTPSAGDPRRLRVTVYRKHGAPETMTPDLTITPVPQASVADTLEGLKASQFVQITGAASPYSINQSSLDALLGTGTAGVTDASSLHHHDDRYARRGADGSVALPGGSYLGLGVRSGNPDTTGWDGTQSGRVWFDSASGEVKYWDGASTKTLGNSSGPAASVATNDITDWAAATAEFLTSASGISAAKVSGDIAGKASGLTSTLSVESGGTGATTLTGLVKGNGTSAFTAAVAGTDYLIASGATTNGRLAQWNGSTQLIDGPALTSSNTANAVVQRDGSGNFSAAAITSTGLVTGSLRITGGTPGSGKVLTSDDSGNASWQAPAASGGGDGITALTGEVTASGTGSVSATLSTAAVTGKPLTGLSTATGGTVSPADSILTAIGKLENRVAINDAKVSSTGAGILGTALSGYSSASGGAVTSSDTILSALGKLGNRTPAVSLSASAPIIYTAATGVISMSAASSSTNGYLTSTDWSAFNGKAPLNAPTFTGTVSMSGAAALAKQGYFTGEVANSIVGGTSTIDWTQGNKQKLTRNGNVTLTFTAPGGPTNVALKLVHDATATAYTVAFPASVKWPNGAAPALTNAANAVDIISCYYDGANYYCMGGTNFL